MQPEHVRRYPAEAHPLLVLGATGTLGRAFAHHCESEGIPYRLLSRMELDLSARRDIDTVLAAMEWSAVINAAGYVRIDDAEREPGTCFLANVTGPVTLAEACRRRRIPMVAFSSDLVFDGRRGLPYVESDRVAPLGVYGWSKAEMEPRVLAALPSALVIRTSSFFGPSDDGNFVTRTLRRLDQGETVSAASDVTMSPTYVPDLVKATLDLLLEGERGIWHLANQGAVTWAELAQRAAELAGLAGLLPRGLARERIEARPFAELGHTAARPAYSALGTERGRLLPPLEDALARFYREWTARGGVRTAA